MRVSFTVKVSVRVIVSGYSILQLWECEATQPRRYFLYSVDKE